jgi:carboxymethylenebutenolidase
MATLDVDIPTPDGTAAGSLHVPDVGTGSGDRWPAVLMYPDAGGTREVFRQMGERLAAEGYVVLVPDVYYRSGGYEPFSMATVFTDPDERARLGTLTSSLTPERAATDAAAYADFLAARPEVTPGPIGTTGYCMGGRLSLLAAGRLGDRVGAAASFHGGRLAVADDPTSPHQLAGDVRAVVYVGAAENDATFDDDQAARLHEAYDAAGVDHTIDTYAAAHGFAVPDMPTYDEAAAERHWQAMANLYGSALG